MTMRLKVPLTAALVYILCAAATAPVAPSSAKDALEGFLRALVAGDEKKATSYLYFSNPDHEAAAQALMQEIASGQRLRHAVDKRFPAPNLTVIVAEHDRHDLMEMIKAIPEPAHARIAATAAELTLAGNSKFYLVYRDGHWKIDFEKTQDEQGGMPSKSELDAAKVQAKALDQLAADVAAGKFEKVEQVEALYQQITSPPPAASTHPASAPH